MKTPTPQGQAEMLIEAHLPNTEQFDYRNGYQPDEDAATESAIVTVEEIIKAIHYREGTLMADLLRAKKIYWQEVLTILKRKL